MANNQAKILVVDDSETNRLMLSFMLQELSFTTDEVENGEQAVEQALEFDYAAVFMDLNMPVMDGLEATNVLYNLSYERPIFACSAEDDPAKIKKLLDSGFTDFMPKPIEPEDVEAILQKHHIENQSTHAINDEAFQQKLDQLCRRFLRNIPTIISKINRTVNSDDLTGLKRIAHKLKGTASQFGFDKITIIGRDIELAISKDKIPIAIEKANFLIGELEKILREK